MDTESTYKHLGEEVYVRYDPADLRSVRVYDTNDKYLWTWACADVLMVDYITDCKKDISDAMEIQRRTQKFIKAEAKAITNGLDNNKRIDLLDMATRKAHNDKAKFKIVMPTNIINIRADETQEQLQTAVGEEVIIDLTKINEKIARNKNREE